ncbi:hypothetical protein GQ44DRAFT_404022 [Phaeosphaeriaceae sp. PMI808]|nr:hypothetical protein GQ44DRAFT_404022 [Phaeosphaeriaceae sp. PMI808]
MLTQLAVVFLGVRILSSAILSGHTQNGISQVDLYSKWTIPMSERIVQRLTLAQSGKCLQRIIFHASILVAL